MTKFTIINRLKNYALESKLAHQLAACVISGNKVVSTICCNTDRSMYKGVSIGSCHAEAHAILSYFGKNLSFDPCKGWCVLWN